MFYLAQTRIKQQALVEAGIPGMKNQLTCIFSVWFFLQILQCDLKSTVWKWKQLLQSTISVKEKKNIKNQKRLYIRPN